MEVYQFSLVNSTGYKLDGDILHSTDNESGYFSEFNIIHHSQYVIIEHFSPQAQTISHYEKLNILQKYKKHPIHCCISDYN